MPVAQKFAAAKMYLYPLINQNHRALIKLNKTSPRIFSSYLPGIKLQVLSHFLFQELVKTLQTDSPLTHQFNL